MTVQSVSWGPNNAQDTPNLPPGTSVRLMLSPEVRLYPAFDSPHARIAVYRLRARLDFKYPDPNVHPLVWHNAILSTR
jgi:hypothetical protein